jgi:hypothetical protein
MGGRKRLYHEGDEELKPLYGRGGVQTRSYNLNEPDTLNESFVAK